jgi:homoserine O-acetyltransferase
MMHDVTNPRTTIGPIGDLPLHHGGVLRNAELAYVTYGRLAPDGRNAVLLTHGFTSSHLFAEPEGTAPGSWSTLVGSGRPIDTDRYFVVSSNMLGSSYGSTAPRSVDPDRGRPYGPDFPRITLADIVAAQRRLLDRLGVRELVAVIGPSYGGFQAFTWGVEYPDFVRAVVPVTTGLSVGLGIDVEALGRRFAAEPSWNGGHHYGSDGMLGAMTAYREATLRRYGIDAVLAAQRPELDAAARAALVSPLARDWARSFDPHSLLALAAAANEYDVTTQLARLRARVLFVLSTTDLLFPPSLASPVMAALQAAGVDASYHELESDHGHLAPGIDAAKWAPALTRFLAELAELG